ncbi:hypothetical protein PG994_013685 [Apiospora phragmitis]|uniref:Uncharacterized protein n=1 Tax=Apiospora phragmitis TaxID=2905665 RepID=A0ABR1T9C2_9PEZI
MESQISYCDGDAPISQDYSQKRVKSRYLEEQKSQRAYAREERDKKTGFSDQSSPEDESPDEDSDYRYEASFPEMPKHTHEARPQKLHLHRDGDLSWRSCHPVETKNDKQRSQATLQASPKWVKQKPKN